VGDQSWGRLGLITLLKSLEYRHAYPYR
jgi:hypothetical protein